MMIIVRRNCIPKFFRLLNLAWHCGRHTFAVMSLQNGLDLYTLSKLMGHSSVKMTEIYAKVVDETKTDALNIHPYRLNQCLFGEHLLTTDTKKPVISLLILSYSPVSAISLKECKRELLARLVAGFTYLNIWIKTRLMSVCIIFDGLGLF